MDYSLLIATKALGYQGGEGGGRWGRYALGFLLVEEPQTLNPKP